MNGDPERLTNAGIKTLKCIGDSFAPATIAAAVYSGHLAARELQAEPQEEVPFLRERIQIWRVQKKLKNRGPPWLNQLHIILMFIALATTKRGHTIKGAFYLKGVWLWRISGGSWCVYYEFVILLNLFNVPVVLQIQVILF